MTKRAANRRQMLVALMMPQLMVVINLSIISVALPAIRETFAAPADLMAWVVTIYSLPYVALMPLYGRLGDDLGIRRMLLVGAVVFLIGTMVNAASQSLPLLLLGRFIQGIGASGTTPLAIAMVSRIFPAETRGRTLGQWNSIGPVASVAGSLLGGIIIDALGWRSVFVVPLLASCVAFTLVYRVVRAPTREAGATERQTDANALRAFDWTGALLLAATLAALLFYISSRTVTGRPPLTDWRVLLVTVVLLTVFVRYERRQAQPFIDLSILLDGTFSKASIASATRMFVMSGTSFLNPLFLADVKGLNATAIGLIVMIRAIALFPTIYFGGRVADRWGSRRPIVVGLSGQAASVVLMAFSGADDGLTLVIASLILYGLSAGLALPALHRTAMSGPDGQRDGAAAGLYSMIRFWGMMLGTALAGVLLQALLDRGLVPVTSYRYAYAATVVVGIIGVIIVATLKENQPNTAT